MLSGAIFIMNELSELDRRRAAIAEARRLYIATGKTRNISEAMRLYIRAHPSECEGVRAFISTREKDRPKTIVDDYERPKCRKCGGKMFLKLGCAACKGPVNKNYWICKECGFKHYTKKSLPEILAGLKRLENGKS